jgi:hypothetical protein
VATTLEDCGLHNVSIQARDRRRAHALPLIIS